MRHLLPAALILLSGCTGMTDLTGLPPIGGPAVPVSYQGRTYMLRETATDAVPVPAADGGQPLILNQASTRIAAPDGPAGRAAAEAVFDSHCRGIAPNPAGWSGTRPLRDQTTGEWVIPGPCRP